MYIIIGGILNFRCVIMVGKRDSDISIDIELKYMISILFFSDLKLDVVEMFKKMGDKLGWF